MTLSALILVLSSSQNKALTTSLVSHSKVLVEEPVQIQGTLGLNSKQTLQPQRQLRLQKMKDFLSMPSRANRQQQPLLQEMQPSILRQEESVG